MAPTVAPTGIDPADWTRATGDWGDQDPRHPLPGYFPHDPADWFSQHAAQRTMPGRGQARVVLVGDSLLAHWRAPAQAEVWERCFAGCPAHVVAIPGDRTQQLLWRIAHGALDGLAPALVVLLAGVNNLWSGRQDDGQVAAGLAAVVAAIRTRLPKADVLHLGILPALEPADHPVRRAAARVNRAADPLSRAAGARFLDAGAAFVEADGRLSPVFLPDNVHLAPAGYARLAALLHPHLAALARIP